MSCEDDFYTQKIRSEYTYYNDVFRKVVHEFANLQLRVKDKYFK